MEWYQKINSLLLPDGPSPLRVQVTGGSWGLACNSIHFIDLVSWWSHAAVRSVSTEGLSTWIPSKRTGFYEVLGTLSVSYSDGSELELYCGQGNEPVQIIVSAPQGDWVINESLGSIQGPSGRKLLGKLDFQSSLTAPLVRDILHQGSSSLPKLSESLSQHRPLIASLLHHWNTSEGNDDTVVPIT